MPAATITGADGREVSLRSANGYIQWRYPDTEWENLVALSTLQGAKGTDGADGKEVAMRVVSDTLQWRLGTTGTWQSLMQMATATQDATFGGAVVGSKLVLAAGTATGGGR